MRTPLWAVLSTEPPERLAQFAPRDSEVLAGRAGHNALVGSAPENVLGEEEDLAEALTAAGGTAFALRLGEEPEILRYSDGECDDEIDDDPYAFAAALGCELPGAPPPRVL